MNAWLRRLLLIVFVVLILAGLTYLLIPGPVAVDVARVERGPMEVTVDDEGRTRVIDRYTVTAPLAGRMRRHDWRAGDAVRAGETLVRFEPTPADLQDPRTRDQAAALVQAGEATVQRTAAQLRAVESQRAFAQREMVRLERLVETDAAPLRELDEARTTLEIHEHQLDAARWNLRVAEHERDVRRAAYALYTPGELRDDAPQAITIAAPVTGSIFRLHEQSEAVIAAGTPLLEIGDPAQLEVVVEVLSEEAARIEAGMRVYLERWGGEQTLRGTVRHVEPSGFTDISALGVEEQRVNVIIDFDEPAEAFARLGDRFRVQARIVVWQEDDVLQIPTGALFRRDDRWMVYRIINGRAEPQQVSVGRQTALRAQVLARLEEGDEVILYPAQRIEPGTRVSRR